MNNIKDKLDALILKLEIYKFTVNKSIKLIDLDIEQLNKGGDFFSLSSIYIRDWGNYTDNNWMIDYKRLLFHDKNDYIAESKKIKANLYKHYLIETYERLFDFLAFVLEIDRIKADIRLVCKTLDAENHNKPTPFGFSMITFLFSFCRARNSFTHNESIVEEIITLEKFDYLKKFNITLTNYETFLTQRFSAKKNNKGKFVLHPSKKVFDEILGFTVSYALEIYRFYGDKTEIDQLIQSETEKHDLKTNKPLTDNQREYIKSVTSRIN
ncbi:hypothetical protein [Pedobacter helvus]|uniref:Abi-like protein n=1 Tax=Pedobacter helvus TaxID=2563444 RepID=A0ABW9JGR5_9SPHI|nr:hypothetical protein [Pedobacter ureilyticus]